MPPKSKIVLSLLFMFSLFFSACAAGRAGNQVNGYFFWGDGCPHCGKEKEFLAQLQIQYPEFIVYSYEVYNSTVNAARLQQAAVLLGDQANGVPYLVIGDQRFVGFGAGITDLAIKNRLEYCRAFVCPDTVGRALGLVAQPALEPKIVAPPETVVDSLEIETAAAEPLKNATAEVEAEGIEPAGAEPVASAKTIDLPLVGQVDAVNFSLPLITIIMGGLDGFNPCAMWILLFLISLLVGMANKKQMWLLGGAFILISGAVYFIFMAAWLNLIIFFGLIFWVRLIIAGVALGGGVYNLREYIVKKNASCSVVGHERREKIFGRIKRVVQQNNFALALIGICGLAVTVNLVELLCSAGLPVVYTQILALNDLAGWQYYGYLCFYVLIFMLDDLLVFVAAMLTLQVTGITTKYTRLTKLIGGLLMVIIGLLLLFKPDWLMFG